MDLVKNTSFILIALFIDGLQAAISWGIATIAAFPGTVAGGAAGCALGDAAAGQIGCWIGGLVLGFFGTAANPLLAPITVPVGIAIGFAVSMCLSIALGWCFLVPLMYFNGIKPHRQLPLGAGEVIPGINNIPFWTFFAIASLWAHVTEEGPSERRSLLGTLSFALPATRGVMSLKEQTMKLPRVPETLSAMGLQQQRIDQPTSERELVRASERVPLHDIRPAKTNAQTA